MNKHQPPYAAVGIIIGAAAGFSVGLGDPVSAAIGAAVGLLLGAGLDTTKKQNIVDDEDGGEK